MATDSCLVELLVLVPSHDVDIVGLRLTPYDAVAGRIAAGGGSERASVADAQRRAAIRRRPHSNHTCTHHTRHCRLRPRCRPHLQSMNVCFTSLYSVLYPSSIRGLATPWTYFLHLSMSSVILIDSSTGSPVHVLMLSTQAVRGLPHLRAPGIFPCIISFSRQLPCFLGWASGRESGL